MYRHGSYYHHHHHHRFDPRSLMMMMMMMIQDFQSYFHLCVWVCVGFTLVYPGDIFTKSQWHLNIWIIILFYFFSIQWWSTIDFLFIHFFRLKLLCKHWERLLTMFFLLDFILFFFLYSICFVCFFSEAKKKWNFWIFFFFKNILATFGYNVFIIIISFVEFSFISAFNWFLNSIELENTRFFVCLSHRMRVGGGFFFLLLTQLVSLVKHWFGLENFDYDNDGKSFFFWM